MESATPIGKIMLVEDNDFFRESFAGILESYLQNISIVKFPSADGVLESISKDPPDLVFLDIKMPGMNGLDLLKKIKTVNLNVTVVVFTSYDIPEYKKAALECGANAFIVKDSLSGQTLARIVEELFARKNHHHLF